MQKEVSYSENKRGNADGRDGESEARGKPRCKKVSVHPTKLRVMPQVRNRGAQLMSAMGRKLPFG